MVFAAEPADPARQRTVLLWASQTGNAETLAADVVAQLAEAGLPIKSKVMDEFAATDLPAVPQLLVITSTTG